MATLEIITIGGGQQLIAVLNAVAAWCGGGGFRGLLEVVLVIGLTYALLIMAMHLNWKVLYNWFVTSVLMYSCLIVPTTTVVVTDKINPTAGSGAVANVPIGLAAIASFTSQANYWMTSTAETVFNVPGNLTMSGYGMVYPIRLIDASRQYTITDPILKTNLENYMQDCYFLPVIQNPATSVVSPLTSLIHGDILASIGPGSTVRFVQYIGSDGVTTNIACNVAYGYLSAALPTWANTTLAKTAKSLFPDIASPTAALAKLNADTHSVTAAMYGRDMSAQQLMLQRSLIDAFNEAQSHLGGAEGDTFAQMRANVQAKNEMSLAARQALIWVPVLELVLTIVFYAMFPLVFPLMLLPGGGVSVLKSYVTGFFYLISWGSVSAVLHLFILYRTSASMVAGAGGEGFTMGTSALLDGMNADAGALAGYLLMSVPIIAGGLAKGAMSLSHGAGAMLSPVQSGATAGALERTTGSYGYGNVTANQFNTAPTHVTGAGTSTVVNSNGTRTTRTADGGTVYDNSGGISRFGMTVNDVQSDMQSLSTAAAQFNNQGDSFRSSASRSYQTATSHANSVISGFSSHTGSEGGRVNATETGHSLDGGLGKRTDESSRSGVDVNQGFRKDHGQSDSSGTSYSGGFTGSASVSTPGGGKGGAGAGGGLQVSGSRVRDTRENDSAVFTGGVTSTAGDGKSSTTYKVGNDTWRFNESGVTRNGSFYRYDQLGESRNSLEKSFRDAKSYEEQASQSYDKGFRLDQVVQNSRQNGWQMTDDMSQVIASRYNQVAGSEKYAALGAPSLSNVNPTPYQAQVRHEIVRDIMKDYALEGGAEGAAFRSQVEAGMKEPHPSLGVPTFSQMQAAKASLGPDPKGASRPKGGQAAGANPAGALGKIEGVNKGIADDAKAVDAEVRQANSLVSTHQ